MQELSSLGRSSGPGSLLSGFASTRAPNFSLVARAGDGEELSGEERGKQAKGRQEDRGEEAARGPRGGSGRAIRSRAGCVQLEEKLEICGS